MRHYETIYIVAPDLSEDDYRDVIKKFQGVLEKNKAVVVKVKEWGKQRLAYLIKKYDKGTYVLVEYCGLPGIAKAFERDLKLDDRILKFQTVKLADQVDPQELVKIEEDAKKELEATQETAEGKEETKTEEETPPAKEVTNGL